MTVAVSCAVWPGEVSVKEDGEIRILVGTGCGGGVGVGVGVGVGGGETGDEGVEEPPPPPHATSAGKPNSTDNAITFKVLQDMSKPENSLYRVLR